MVALERLHESVALLERLAVGLQVPFEQGAPVALDAPRDPEERPLVVAKLVPDAHQLVVVGDDSQPCLGDLLAEPSVELERLPERGGVALVLGVVDVVADREGGGDDDGDQSHAGRDRQASGEGAG